MKSLVFTILFALCAMTALAADVSGKWSGTFTPEGQEASNAYVVLKQAGTSVTGTGGPNAEEQWPLTNGKIEGNHLTAQCTSPDGVVYKIDVTVDGDKARGEVTATQEGQAMKGKIELSRVKS
jgi:hypothetical protein